jgi:hypothetical protein
VNVKSLGVVLDDCLRRMAESGASAEDVLALYPEQGSELEPLLRAGKDLERGRALIPPAAIGRNGRAPVVAHARTHPPRHASILPPAWRLAISLAVLVIVAMLSTTAFVQAALPGEPLYGWKLPSEQVWRAIAPDRVGVDLALVDRRADELTSVARDPGREAQAMDGLHEALTQLQAEDNAGNGPRIQPALGAHQKKLSDAGITDKQLEAILHGKP